MHLFGQNDGGDDKEKRNEKLDNDKGSAQIDPRK
jgi:hypothetical protein